MHQILIAVLVLGVHATSIAQEWESPDGLFSVKTPNAETFTLVPSIEKPYIGLWVSKDETVKLAVLEIPIPQGEKLIQSAMEEGLAEAIGGKVIRLPNTNVSGYEVWNMSASGAAGKITQAVFVHGNTVYKLMAVTAGSDQNDELGTAFIKSLSFPKIEPSTSSNSTSVKNQ